MSTQRSFFFSLATALFLVSAGVAKAELNIVVTSKPIHALVSAVMAGIGTPKILVDGPASPHSYAMKPSDAQAVNQADVFFRVSEEFEPFTAKLVRSLPERVKVISLAEAPGVKLLPRREGATFDRHSHDHGPDHRDTRHHRGKHDHRDAGGHDPHVWLDPENAKAMVSHIADVLASFSPDKASVIRQNATAELDRISKLSGELSRELAPIAGKKFIVYHDAYQYFEKRFGLTAAGSITLNPDIPPSGKRLQEIRRKISSANVQCVFADPNISPRVTATITEDTSARTVVLDPEGMTLEAGPDLYHRLMRQLAGAMKSCLAN